MAAPFLRRHLRTRVVAGKEIPNRLGERRGYSQMMRPRGRLVWLHAASVGETVSVLPVITALLEQPDLSVLMTTGTVTSASLLALRSDERGWEGRVLHRFVPLDVPRWGRRFLDHWRPDVAGFVESEIWPNLMRSCHRRRIPLMLINARMSRRSFARWRLVPGARGGLFRRFAAVQAQTDADAQRFRRLGARVVTSPGNLKFATPPLPVDEAELARLQALLGHAPRWLAASTHPGEEAIARRVHEALARLHPGLITIIAPRHPERGEEIAEGAPRRALGQDPPPGGGVWVADTLGEMGLLFRLSPIVFVGCSLAVGGGHNPLEPARLGCAVAMGPMVANCIEAVEVLRAAGALESVADEDALRNWVETMLAASERVAGMGQAGIAAASATADLPAQVAQMLLGLVPQQAA
jgi:3-deoxy-D-manno-octulosonic-acid transferase